jgi:hypothetical protein
MKNWDQHPQAAPKFQCSNIGVDREEAKQRRHGNQHNSNEGAFARPSVEGSHEIKRPIASLAASLLRG